jgi:hypothetical protein
MLQALARGLYCTFLLTLIAWFSPISSAQQLSGGGKPESSTLVLQNLTDGAVPLDGPWQFHLGDHPAWAAPSYDDSHWEQLSADKPWGEQNHPSYTGYAWYRRRIAIHSAGTPSDLALMFRRIDDAYEIYWNGKLIGRHGAFPPHAVWYAFSQPPATFGWPSPQEGVMAIRVWKAPLLSEDSGLSGGFTAAPLAGTPAAIVAAKAKLDYEWLRSRQFVFGEDLIYALVALISLLVWLRYRSQWTLLWMATFALASISRQLVFMMALSWPMAVVDGIAAPISSLRDISLWFLLLTLLQLRDKQSIRTLTLVFSFISLVSTTTDGLISIFWWTSDKLVETQIADAVTTAFYILTAALPLLLVPFAFSRKRRLDAGSRLIAILAFLSGMIQVVSNVAAQGSRFTHWTLADRIAVPLFVLDGNSISIVPLAGMLLLISIVFGVYRNSLEARRRQIALEQEFLDAQELQRALIPETLRTLAGYALTSSYLPAAEVGGDFFQLIPAANGDSGTTLVVVGDVSGKGLKAAMSVALIVGALRTLAETTSSPAEILAGINRRICGRLQDGFVTCLILRLGPDGACVLANAGHPPPYLNDREMDVPGALPLGLMSDLSYQEFRTTLHPHDHLILYTDGLLEARNITGELYGFERMYSLFAKRPNAAEAARVAVDFGQDDDITVLTLTRME